MRALLFANGDLNPGPLVDEALTFAPEALIVAADGGARHTRALGLTPHLIIGDMDSLSEDEMAGFTAQGVAVQRHPPAKDETDLELALLYAARQGADWIRVIGGMGDRLDQTLGNVFLLTLPQLVGRDVRLLVGHQAAWLLRAGENVIYGAAGDTLSLLPLGGDVSGITTTGLQYALRDGTLFFGPARGISNVMTGPVASVRLREGLLLAVYTPGRA